MRYDFHQNVFPSPFLSYLCNQSHACNDKQHQNKRKPGTDIPVASLFKFLLYNISDQKDLASSEKIRYYKCRKRRYKYHCDAADDAGNTKRQYDLKKCLRSVRTEISGSMDNIFVNLRQHIVDRKYHKRKKVVYHSENDGRWSIDDRLAPEDGRNVSMLLMTPFFSRSVCHAKCPQEENSSTSEE